MRLKAPKVSRRLVGGTVWWWCPEKPEVTLELERKTKRSSGSNFTRDGVWVLLTRPR
jgi:hypothetical protein